MKRAFVNEKDPKNVPKEEWKRVLTEEEYRVTQEHQTEAPFTGKFEKHFEKGQYVCNCCGAELFSSKSKYDAQCGWPSFFDSKLTPDSKSDANISRKADNSVPNRPRTAVQCTKCDAHLGHVFDDEDTPTGERYCINSVSLDFTTDDKKRPSAETHTDEQKQTTVAEKTNESEKEEKQSIKMRSTPTSRAV